MITFYKINVEKQHKSKRAAVQGSSECSFEDMPMGPSTRLQAGMSQRGSASGTADSYSQNDPVPARALTGTLWCQKVHGAKILRSLSFQFTLFPQGGSSYFSSSSWRKWRLQALSSVTCNPQAP